LQSTDFGGITAGSQKTWNNQSTSQRTSWFFAGSLMKILGSLKLFKITGIGGSLQLQITPPGVKNRSRFSFLNGRP
jgi:hypothetical protein